MVLIPLDTVREQGEVGRNIVRISWVFYYIDILRTTGLIQHLGFAGFSFCWNFIIAGFKGLKRY